MGSYSRTLKHVILTRDRHPNLHLGPRPHTSPSLFPGRTGPSGPTLVQVEWLSCMDWRHALAPGSVEQHTDCVFLAIACPPQGHRQWGWAYLDSSVPSQNTTVYSWPWEEKKDDCFPHGSIYMNVANVGSFIWFTTDKASGR